ncbi:ABC transporter substrate-binding protein [Geodermatophilus sabuli]|uniref:Peptide/nickel transport system substrate-binding protein n=1 Tax=Geodermatophilus sabuli TaxID=1564158 RepID=A0A285EAH4_9ACTN|nr:ABC transporter substrate-binding protein [Geodermatophilus sabuli]MBB3082042.1 peptide/nickel transport system substrate-binding protein [Geodermatophilus sabuli]SNX95086.1 peptide/nickel transport system substrate-binding protein [Geodermatophilus sabuli]
MKKRTIPSILLATALALSACGGGGSGDANPGTQAAAGEPQQGGELTVLEDAAFAGSWPTGLDPASNTTGGANIAMMQAIYGGLFLLRADDDGSNARIEGHQAESSELSEDGLTLTVKLREGIEFSDGTPLDAEAVKFNWERALAAPCSCKPAWQLAEDPIRVVDPLTVSITFTSPNGAVMSGFPASNVNWIASPTALQQMGEDAFKIKPVGAGPFVVVDNQLSTTLELERNPHYFKEGLPYLDELTFQSIGGDQPAYQALQAGQAQAYEGMNTTPLVEQARNNGQMQVTIQAATSPYVIQLNTKAAPFDDPRAREAIYRATDFDAINEGIFGGNYEVSQGFTAPGGKFYEREVTGYPEYDLERAKELVEELGGLTVNLGTISNYVATQINTALQTQWQEAGIEVTIEDFQLSGLVESFNSGQWQAMLQTAGAWDPAAGVGVGFRFTSTSPFSGIADPELDALLADAAGTLDEDERADLYRQAAEHLAENFYSPFGLAFAPANLAVQGVHGPGLTTEIPPLLVNTGVIWDEVWREQG